MPTSLIKGHRETRAKDTEGSTSRIHARDEDGPHHGSAALRGKSSGGEVTGEPGAAAAITQKPKRGRLLNNLSIRSKVVLILIVPIAAILIFAGLRINDSRLKAQDAEEVNSLAKVGDQISALVHQLQEERSRASTILAANVQPGPAGLKEQGVITDEAAADFRDLANNLGVGDNHNVTARVHTALGDLKTLPSLRNQVLNKQLSADDATARYTAIISDQLSVTESVGQTTSEPEISAAVNALAAFSRYKEYASQETYVLYTVIRNGHFEPGQYRDFVNTLANQEGSLLRFNQEATSKQRDELDRVMPRAQVARATNLETIATRGENASDLGIQEQSWLNATTKRADLMRKAEQQFSDQVTQISQRLRDNGFDSSLTEGGFVLVVLVVAIVVSLMVARSMIRPLVRLRSSALEVAYENLPDVVRRLRDVEGTRSGGSDEVQASAARMAHGVDISSNDEIGQVAQAFNAIHQEAVRVATEQAQLRLSVAAMFVNLARRSQLLVDRLIRLIDKLEQGERDPDRLAELFRLDHLATRMRRNDENLLVLAGAEGGRRWAQTAPLIDVLRAAVAEVEQYTRIKIGSVDDAEITAKAVNDIVHLVAELLENATSFSSPRTEVLVDARIVHDQVVIEVEDQGIGMSREQLTELNERLAKPPILDVTVSRMMGLFVVGRLSTRHGIRVMLRTSAGGGVVAIVTLPSDTLVPSPSLPALPAGAETEGEIVDAESAPSTPEPHPWGERPRLELPPGSSNQQLGNASQVAGSASGSQPLPEQSCNDFAPPVPPQRDGMEHSGEHHAVTLDPDSYLETQPSSSPPAGNASPVESVTPTSVPPIYPVSAEPTSSPRPTSAAPSPPPSSAPPAAPPVTSAPPTTEQRTTSPQRQWRYHDANPSDPTVEMPLPIYESLGSEWFRPARVATTAIGTTSLPASDPAGPPGPIAASSQAPPMNADELGPKWGTDPSREPSREPIAQHRAEPASATPVFEQTAMPTPESPAWRDAAAPERTRTYREAPVADSTDTEPSLRSPSMHDAAPEPPSYSPPPTNRATEEQSAPAHAEWRDAIQPGTSRPEVRERSEHITSDEARSVWSPSAIDRGWERAALAAEPQVGDVTPVGLPKRVPMANFVPGGMESATKSPADNEKTPQVMPPNPDNVRGLLSSYRQGLEQGRLAGRSRRSAVVTDSDDQNNSSHVQQEEQ